jgi:tetraacyldisaccharide 4'-kinase
MSVVTGRRRGAGAALVRAALWLCSLVYAFLHGLRRLMYAVGVFRRVKLPVPVVSVGNLTAGGTGKTPFVEHLARWFTRRNLRVAIVARGYGRMAGGRDDEELPVELDNVARFTGADRVAAARRAIAEFRPDVIVLDDGFQHYRIERDLDILLIDATNPFAGGRRLPAGLLRESPSAARRAGLIVVTRADQAGPEELVALRDRLDRLAPAAARVEAAHKPVAVRLIDSKKRQGLEWLKGRALFAFCGIGNPESFKRTIEAAGGRVEKFVAFEDHHAYTPAEVRRLNAEAEEFMAEAIVTTEKDATKLGPAAFSRPLAALRIEIELLRGETGLDAALQGIRPTAPVAEASAR